MILWPVFIVLKALLIIAGLFLCLIGAAFKTWPRLLWLWGDDEYRDHIDWWYRRGFPKTRYWKDYWWHAIRNPVANHKYLFSEPSTVRAYGLDEPGPTYHNERWAWRYRVGGWKSSFRFVFKWSDSRYIEIYLGWKIGSNVPGVGFATSVRPWGKY